MKNRNGAPPNRLKRLILDVAAPERAFFCSKTIDLFLKVWYSINAECGSTNVSRRSTLLRGIVRLFAGAHVGLKSVDEFQQALFFYPSAGEAKVSALRAPPKSGGGGGLTLRRVRRPSCKLYKFRHL